MKLKGDELLLAPVVMLPAPFSVTLTLLALLNVLPETVIALELQVLPDVAKRLMLGAAPQAPPAEQEATAAMLLLVKVQVAAAEKAAVMLVVAPLAFILTPEKVWEMAVVVEPTAMLETVLLLCKPVPLRFKVPVVGLLVNETVTSAV